VTELQDYYKTLQVHPQAEQEVIEAAYKRLAKKYHPDVAGSELEHSEMTMQRINQAYEILKDGNRRKAYHAQWQQVFAKVNHEGPTTQKMPASIQQSIMMAASTVTKYFEAIQATDYKEAYQLISRVDRQRLSLELFTQWQQAVRQIFALQNVSIQPGLSDLPTNIASFKDGHVLRFVVMTVDYNSLMERLEQDAFERRVVREQGQWRVQLGATDVEGAIRRFQSLSELMATKSHMKAYIDSYSKHDRVNGVFNKRGILELVDREGLRSSRYGRRFSLIMFGVVFKKSIPTVEQNAIEDYVAESLVRFCRELDSIGRWQEQVFMILMPETDLKGALQAAQKLKRKLSELCGRTPSKATCDFPIGVDVYPGSVAMAIDRLDFLYEASLKHKKFAIQSMRGPLE